MPDNSAIPPASNSIREPLAPDNAHLKKSLGPVMLWGLGVGYVISGDYFGWNLGLAAGGSFGLLIAFGLMTVMAVTFVFSYTELACAVPRAGGVFVYATRGLGLTAGFLGGTAQAVEFVFAPPAIAMAIGTYISDWLPALDKRHVALAAYVVFTTLNVWGVRQAATFELVVTVLAVGGIALFAAITLPHFELASFTANALPHGSAGVLAAVPFAIWFYLAIEGVANAAEEARNPQRDVAIGFGSAIGTLVVLACLVLAACVGVGGWERVVFDPADLSVGTDGQIAVADSATPLDNPLLLAAAQIMSQDSLLYHALVGIGLMGFIASFNGIILIAGRALFDMGRVGFLPHALGHTNRRTATPVNALVVNMIIGAVAIYFFDTAGLITLSAMGAVTLYIASMLSVIALRRREPQLPRPYRVPLYPLFPCVALILAALALATMLWSNFNNTSAPNEFQRWISLWYVCLLLAAVAYFHLLVKPRLTLEDLEHFHRID